MERQTEHGRQIRKTIQDLLIEIPFIGKAAHNLMRRKGGLKTKLGAGVVLVIASIIALLFINGRKNSNPLGVQINNSGETKGNVFFTIGNSNTINNNTIHVPQPSNTAPPQLPLIRIETLDGLPMSWTNDTHVRFHRLVVRNFNDLPIETFCSRLQLPEPIVATTETNQTPGTLVGWRPLLMKMNIVGTGGRSESGIWLGPTSAFYNVYPEECFVISEKRSSRTEISGNGQLTGIWELTISRLPPGGHVTIEFVTTTAQEATNYIAFAGVPIWTLPPVSEPNTNELRFYLEGEYRYPTGTKLEKQHFLVPLLHNGAQRKVASLAVQRDVGSWNPVVLNLY